MDTRFPHHRLVTDYIGSYLFICFALLLLQLLLPMPLPLYLLPLSSLHREPSLLLLPILSL
jgi:hypothetical protein